jgi:hypothetical protein
MSKLLRQTRTRLLILSSDLTEAQFILSQFPLGLGSCVGRALCGAQSRCSFSCCQY